MISEILKYSSLELSFFICCCFGCTCADIKTFTASFELNRAAYLRKGIFKLFLVNKTNKHFRLVLKLELLEVPTQ